MRDYRFWIYVAVIGLTMSLTVRLIAEATSTDARKIEFLDGQLDILNNRLIKLESKSHPATSKRFNSDDARAMEIRIAECVDAGKPMKPCLEHKAE
jgi:hypothetical protein